MTVDLSKAKAGDTVKFRCRGEAVIEDIFAVNDTLNGYSLRYEGVIDRRYLYWKDGVNKDSAWLTDITEVLPAPVAFDWDTVKWGWAFLHNEQDEYPEILTYIGKNIGGTFVFQVGRNPRYLSFDNAAAQYLTRAPKHDVEGV